MKTIWGGNRDCDHEWVEKEWYKDSPTRVGIGQGNSAPKHEERWKKTTSCSKCGAWQGQLGLEPHFQMFVDHITEIGTEIHRILRKDGSWYLNLGDTYYSGAGAARIPGGKNHSSLEAFPSQQPNRMPQHGVRAKSRLLIPHRVAISLEEHDWILRNDIIWYKTNSMPSSVTDRLSNKFEYIFHFVKSKKYYYDLDAIRVPHKCSDRVGERKSYPAGSSSTMLKGEHQKMTGSFVGLPINSKGKNPGDVVKVGVDTRRKPPVKPRGKGWEGSWPGGGARIMREGDPRWLPEGGKNPGDFWKVNTKPFAEAHFAVYPEELCERPIKSSCPVDGIVLDPFAGSGTTCLVAKRLLRKYIGIELNPDYIEIAKKRLLTIPERLEKFF